MIRIFKIYSLSNFQTYSTVFFFFKFLIYYLFIIFLFLAVLGLCLCVRAFSSCGEWGPLFIAVRGPLTIAASPVAEQRLQTLRLSSCGSQAQLLQGMWDLPRPGLKPMSPALAGRFSTTAPPGKPSTVLLTTVMMLYITPPDLFYNWKFVPFDHLHSFHSTPSPLPLVTTNVFSVSMSSFFHLFFVCLFVLDSTYKWDHMVFFN